MAEFFSDNFEVFFLIIAELELEIMIKSKARKQTDNKQVKFLAILVLNYFLFRAYIKIYK